jgi:hypothetical protein
MTRTGGQAAPAILVDLAAPTSPAGNVIRAQGPMSALVADHGWVDDVILAHRYR